MILSFSLIIVGFVALIFGANWLVDGASALAKRFNISDLAIGLTIVAFGTSAPELIVNAVASINGHSDIVLGNIIGSNNFNLFIILSLAGLVYPIQVQKSTLRQEIPISLIAITLLMVLANDYFSSSPAQISKIDGTILFTFFLGFLYLVTKQMKAEDLPEIDMEGKSNAKIWGLIIIGLTGLIVGGKLVVDYSVAVATDLGVSQKIIGLTIVAAGTSLPELVTSVVAALKKKSDIAIGNVIGSNIFNLLLVIPISSFVRPITFNTNFNQDIFILIGGTVFLLAVLYISKKRIFGRWPSGILLASYLAYTVYLVSLEI